MMANSTAKSKEESLIDLAKDIRRATFKCIYKGGGGHIPASLSIVEILVVLYHRILKIDPQNPKDAGRDRFILSKGHAAVALYTVLAERGFFPAANLERFGKKGSMLGGHPEVVKIPGVEASTGALGHGFSIGAGMALAGKMDSNNFRVFVLLGDGECQEGSIWEAAMFAPQHKLDNLIVIIDYNKIQAMDRLDNIVSLDPLTDKWKAFGWEVKEVNGHNLTQLQEVLQNTPFVRGKPNLIIAHTIKGKGISFMENAPIWHYRQPNREELSIACKDLGISDF